MAAVPMRRHSLATMNEPTTDGWPRSSSRVGRHLAALAVALLTLGVLVWTVGVEAVHAVLADVEASEAALLVVAGLLPLAIWGIELRVVLRGVGVATGIRRATALFAGSGFLNNVTPLGELGGDVPAGLLIAGDRRTTFERGLAAITSLNVLNRVAVVALGVAALAWHGRHLDALGGWSVALAVVAWVALVGALAATWVYRDALVRRLGPPVASAIATVGQWLPIVDPPTPSAVTSRILGFVDALERLAADPRRLATALLLGLLGHLVVGTTLWLAIWTLGARVPLHDALLVIPLAKSSGLSPTPGGAGSATVLVAGLLVVVTGVDAATATAGALLYRAAAFWVPTALGGAVTVWLVGEIPSR